MRFKRILWSVATLVLSCVLFVQPGHGQSGSTATGAQQSDVIFSQDPGHAHTWCPTDRTDYLDPKTQTQATIRDQAALARQLQDYAKAREPMSENELMNGAKAASAETLVKDVKARGVDFDMTPAVEKKLRRANVNEGAIEAARQSGPKVRAQLAKMILGPNSVSIQDIPREQGRKFAAILSDSDPDKAIHQVEGFAKDYPTSPLLSYVYSFGANAYQLKGDMEKVIEYTGKSLKLNPDNLTALTLRVGVLPQPQILRNHAVDRDRVLREALLDGRHALLLISQLPKQPNEADAEYQKRLAGFASEVHGPLGVAHLELASHGSAGPDKPELAKAEQELAIAVSNSSHPDPRDYYRLGEALAMDGKWDDAIQAFTKAGKIGQDATIKAFANEEIGQVKKRKAQDSVASNSGTVSTN